MMALSDAGMKIAKGDWESNAVGVGWLILDRRTGARLAAARWHKKDDAEEMAIGMDINCWELRTPGAALTMILASGQSWWVAEC